MEIFSSNFAWNCLSLLQKGFFPAKQWFFFNFLHKIISDYIITSSICDDRDAGPRWRLDFPFLQKLTISIASQPQVSLPTKHMQIVLCNNRVRLPVKICWRVTGNLFKIMICTRYSQRYFEVWINRIVLQTAPYCLWSRKFQQNAAQ